MRFGAYERKVEQKTISIEKRPILEFKQPKVLKIPPELHAILMILSEQHGVTIEQICSVYRGRLVTRARSEFCKIAYALGVFSSTEIGGAINRDHTLVLYHAGILKRKPKCFKPCAQDQGVAI